MTSRVFALIACAGFSTYLMRLVPLLLTSRRMSAKRALSPRLKGFLNAVGPSFVAVFLVYSILPAAGGRIDLLQMLLKVAALLTVAAVYLRTRNFGTSVLAGLATYGVLYYLAGG
ncbi:MAG TPA: AzlD domain-containing protein [Geomonas sp.]